MGVSFSHNFHQEILMTFCESNKHLLSISQICYLKVTIGHLYYFWRLLAHSMPGELAIYLNVKVICVTIHCNITYSTMKSSEFKLSGYSCGSKNRNAR